MIPEVNEIIKKLNPYIPGEQPKGGGFIKLNTNENPYPPSPAVIKAIKEAMSEKLRLYPDPEFRELRRVAARRWRLSPAQIFVGNGSDEVLRLIFQCYLSRGDSIGSIFPTYILYETLANLFGAEIVFYELNADLSLPAKFFSSLPHKIICISNPNPPFGTLYEIEEITAVCRVNPESIIIVDEAYVDFAQKNALELLRKFNNVVITRSFSKSHGLAGLRIGFAIAQPEVIANLFKAKDSYNVNALAQRAAIAALNDSHYYHKQIRKIIAERERLTAELKKIGFEVLPSEANFIFARWRNDARWLYEGLKKQKILVRYFDHPRLASGLRISIGKQSENRTLIAKLKELIKNEKQKKK